MVLAARRRTVALVACLLLVGGCTQDEPAPDPTSAPSSAEPTDEPTEQPAVEPPAKPAAMANADEAGARAAAEYFIELYEYTFSSGDVEPWDEMCHAESAFCASVRETVLADQESGYSRVGGVLSMTVESAAVSPDSDQQFEVVGTVSQTATELVGADGTVIETEDAASALPIYVVLDVTEEGGWKVRGAVTGDEE